MVSFARYYIANPDLAERLINGWQIATNWDYHTYYGYELGAKGLTDYPFHKVE